MRIPLRVTVSHSRLPALSTASHNYPIYGHAFLSRVVEEFLDRWRNSDLRDKMPKPMLIDNRGMVELNAIGVFRRHQRKGYFNQALGMLTKLCDENGVTITLVARALDPHLGFTPGCPATLSTDQLVAKYERHGFIDKTVAGDDTRTMVREPKKG